LNDRRISLRDMNSRLGFHFLNLYRTGSPLQQTRFLVNLRELLSYFLHLVLKMDEIRCKSSSVIA
jgi:hypothetical protein